MTEYGKLYEKIYREPYTEEVSEWESKEESFWADAWISEIYSKSWLDHKLQWDKDYIVIYDGKTIDEQLDDYVNNHIYYLESVNAEPVTEEEWYNQYKECIDYCIENKLI